MLSASVVKAHRLLWRHGLAPARKDFRPVNYLQRYVRFWRDWRTYNSLAGAERLSLLDSFPQLTDETDSTGVESHYFYQGVWLAKRLAFSRPAIHVDVGSDHRLIGLLT